MEVAKITSKGQITIPISIRRKLELNEGDKVLFIYKPEGVMMVNPSTMNSGYGVDFAEASEAEATAYAANLQEKKAPRSTPAPKSAPKTVAPEPQEEAAAEETAAAIAAPREEIRRPVPPPVDEPEKPAKQIGGLDLGSLLDDIRSIGSNI